MGDSHSGGVSDIQPLSMAYSYSVSSPIDVQLPYFSLHADSGSLQHALDIHVSMLSHRAGSSMHSNMVNVSNTGDGVRLLPSGEHFAESSPAIISLAYDTQVHLFTALMQIILAQDDLGTVFVVI